MPSLDKLVVFGNSYGNALPSYVSSLPVALSSNLGISNNPFSYLGAHKWRNVEELFRLDLIHRENLRCDAVDGLDITASRNVLVFNCDIVTGDDAICVKSQNPYGDLLPTKNITITNCTITTTCNGFKLGTASFGSFENIVFSNSVIYGDANTSSIKCRHCTAMASR